MNALCNALSSLKGRALPVGELPDADDANDMPWGLYVELRERHRAAMACKYSPRGERADGRRKEL
jgi:hypothetical protein